MTQLSYPRRRGVASPLRRRSRRSSREDEGDEDVDPSAGRRSPVDPDRPADEHEPFAHADEPEPTASREPTDVEAGPVVNDPQGDPPNLATQLDPGPPGAAVLDDVLNTTTRLVTGCRTRFWRSGSRSPVGRGRYSAPGSGLPDDTTGFRVGVPTPAAQELSANLQNRVRHPIRPDSRSHRTPAVSSDRIIMYISMLPPNWQPPGPRPRACLPASSAARSS